MDEENKAQEPVAWLFEIGIRRSDHPTLPPYRWEKHVRLHPPAADEYADVRGICPLYTYQHHHSPSDAAEHDLRFAIADFLELRDEAMGQSDDSTEEERLASADSLLAIVATHLKLLARKKADA